jgi:hypothetical protein
MTASRPWGISSVGRAPALQAGGQGFDPPILHSHSISGGVAERYCSSVLTSRRATRGWGFESLRLRNGQPTVSQRGAKDSPSDGGRSVAATRWTVTPQSMGSTPSGRPNALVAQRITHRFPEPGIAGSNPAGGTRARPQAPVAQRIECQSTKLRMGVRFSPGVLTRNPSRRGLGAISPRSSTERASVS